MWPLYAGQHVLTAILAEDSEVRKNNVYEAIDHCKRATYDAFEIGILHFLSEINTFKQDYKYITVTDIIPDYVDKLKKVREAQSFIEVNNRNSINDKSFEMDGRYSEIEVHYNNLEGINHSFDVAREELSKKIVSLRRNLILTILGLIFVIISWIITILVSK